MKYQHSILTLLTVTALTTATLAAETKPGFVDFGQFTPSASGREFVEVNVGSNLISMAARLAEKEEPEIADALRGLEQLRVNVIGLDDENRASVEERIKAIRTQLDGQGWERIATVKEKNQDIAVFMKTHGQESIAGVVVTVMEGDRQAILVNVVGNIKPEKLAIIGERFDVDPLKKLGKKSNRQVRATKEAQ